ncbi:MAG TPA: DoxX family protein [Flavobacterium sp.]|uniref:DoxX family protein n=1 Tax=Flavobacterium sp. TaxID=239 RepID=UPI002DBC07E0|nr:DoxX family protein [Flavobacterium sp.]HEU4789342.1 DoxX family protein [Flavobacterium sp.]
MKLSVSQTNKITVFICYLYILLFTYAAVSKLLDFENFSVQLGQSPLLSAFANVISWLVPLIEILIVLMLVFPRFRLVALFASFNLMLMFTAYIFIVLNFSSFIPCSCGGILEKLGWKEHLIFNIAFILLAIVGILIIRNSAAEKLLISKPRNLIIIFMLSTVLSVGIVAGLFLASENITHYHNKFTRRFPHFPAVKAREANLQLNSYYIAGVDQNKIYLGNTTAQLLVTVLDSTLKQKTQYQIELDHKNLPFKSVKIKVSAPYFYVYDGTVPCIFKGNIRDWKAKLVKKGGEYFSLAEPMDSTIMAVRTQKRGSGESVMATLDLRDTSKTQLNPAILQKQIDGLFDTDGQMVYSKQLNRLVYLYAYRNQYTVADENLTIDYRGNTIDTISHANLNIVNIKSHNQKKLGKQPLIVNKNCAVFNNLLFVNSGIPGRYENIKMWEQASIIDLYDLSGNSYTLSFYIYNEENNKMKNFIVQDSILYALIGNRIVRYNLSKTITKNYQNNSKRTK